MVGRRPGSRMVMPAGSTPGRLQKRHWNVTEGVFEQLLDHSNHSRGTFQQRFFWSAEYWGGPGSPVIFVSAAEGKAEDYFSFVSNATLPGMYAQAVHGAVVILEHRYLGLSWPFNVLSTANLTYLTLQNEVDDVTYFVSNVTLPFDLDRTSAPNKAPWIHYGCSWAGTLVAWISELAPDTFWAHHAGCAAVEAVTDFWQYFDLIRQAMPQNCSADVVKVVDHIDKVLMTGTDDEMHGLKTSLGAGDLASDDFAALFLSGPYQWSFDRSRFYQWCDYVEVSTAPVVGLETRLIVNQNAWPGSNNPVPGAEGVGMEKALAGYVKWINDQVIPFACPSYGYPEFDGPNSVKCFDTHDPSSPMYTDLSINNTVHRQPLWIRCNFPYEQWQTGAPEGTPSIASRLVNVAYFRRQCALLFPPEDGVTYGIAAGKSAADLNALTGGWDKVQTKRIIWSVGELDPMRTASVAYDGRPGGSLASTSDAPVLVVPNAGRCGDELAAFGEADEGVRKVQEEEVATVKRWVQEFYRENGIQGHLQD